MNIKEKAILMLKTIGITIISFITIFIIGKIFVQTEDKQNKQKDKIKDTLSDITDQLDNSKNTLNEQEDIIDDIKTDVEKNNALKDKIVKDSEKKRIEEAYAAGFQKDKIK